MEPWPSTLQPLLNEENFGLTWDDNILRTDMEVGPPKVRRRSTTNVDEFSCSIDLDLNQYSIFENFYKTSLNGGAKTFSFKHPITQLDIELRIKGQVQIRSRGGGNYVALFNVEIMP